MTDLGPGKSPVADDFVRPFNLEGLDLRGRLVRLGPAVDTILTRHDYPPTVATLLGELLALAAALSSALKYAGTLSLQTKGDGPVRLMVADVTSEGAMRAYAQFDAEKLAACEAGPRPDELSVPRLLGAGYLALTVDQGEDAQRHQAIVELTGATLAACIHHYFRQSRQVDAAVLLAAARRAGTTGQPAAWRCGALMIEQVADTPEAEVGPVERTDSDDGWRTALALMASCSSDELLDPGLPADDLLYRLFHECGVRVFPTRPMVFGCPCSADRLAAALRQLPAEDVRSLATDGAIVATCEFCNATYSFDPAELRPVGDLGAVGRGGPVS
jgi:molecular chaperone Hsp33